MADKKIKKRRKRMKERKRVNVKVEALSVKKKRDILLMREPSLIFRRCPTLLITHSWLIHIFFSLFQFCWALQLILPSWGQSVQIWPNGNEQMWKRVRMLREKNSLTLVCRANPDFSPTRIQIRTCAVVKINAYTLTLCQMLLYRSIFPIKLILTN